MEPYKVAPLVGIAAAFLGGLSYIATTIVLRIGQAIDEAFERDLEGLGDDDE